MKLSLNPRVPIVFKKMFGIEENKDLLISLINSILGEENQVVNVTLLNPYSQKNLGEDDQLTLELNAKTDRGKRLTINIRLLDNANYDKKSLDSWGKLQTSRNRSGSEKIIGIDILNFTSISETGKYHNVFYMNVGKKSLELHSIELKKFLEGIDIRIQNPLEIWLAFLTGSSLLFSTSQPIFKRGISLLKIMRLNQEETEVYEGQLKWLLIKINSVKKAEEKGFEKGLQQGIKKGIEQGKREIALALLKQCLSVSQISEATGLSPEEIAKLSD